MRIGFDGRSLMEGKKTGVEEYAEGVLRRLLETDRKNQYVIFLNSFRKKTSHLDWLKKYPNVKIRDFGLPNKLLNFSMWFFGWPKIDLLLGGVEKFFAPNMNFMALSSKCQLVLTIHDLSFERFSSFFSPKRRLWHFLLGPRRICKLAERILAVSRSTKNDLVSLYGLSEKDISVITPIQSLGDYLNQGVSREKLERTRGKYHLPQKFILFLGTIEPRKNLIALIRAFESVKAGGNKEKHHRLKLVLAGRLGWSYGPVMKAIKKSPFREDILFIDYVDAADKPSLYRLSQMLVYPSFYEGFGFPVAEAMAMGTPVITSSTSSLPEVAGDGALLVSPYRPDDLAAAMEIFLGDDQAINRYRRQAVRRAKQIVEEGRLSSLGVGEDFC